MIFDEFSIFLKSVVSQRSFAKLRKWRDGGLFQGCVTVKARADLMTVRANFSLMLQPVIKGL